jgi:hypothetical protein
MLNGIPLLKAAAVGVAFRDLAILDGHLYGLNIADGYVHVVDALDLLQYISLKSSIAAAEGEDAAAAAEVAI